MRTRGSATGMRTSGYTLSLGFPVNASCFLKDGHYCPPSSSKSTYSRNSGNPISLANILAFLRVLERLADSLTKSVRISSSKLILRSFLRSFVPDRHSLRRRWRLAILIRAPADERAVCAECAGVIPAAADGSKSLVRWRGSLAKVITEYNISVVAPADRRTFGTECAGVPIAAAD